MPACQTLSYESGFLSGVLNFVDCQAQNIGAEGYQALAAPGSTLSLLLTGFLTIFVAIYGYRMLFGHTPSAREGVMALAKIGIVLALATSWPAYRTLAYDVALRGPAEIASGVGGPAGLPGGNGGLVARLQGVDMAFMALNKAGVGGLDQRPQVTRTQVVGGQTRTIVESERQPDNFEPYALGWARVLYLTTAVAGFAAVRLAAGLLLALGPFFIAFLLFDATRGLFEGWVRALAAAALGAVGVTVLLGVELALLEPWMTNLLARRAIPLSIVGAPTELMVACLAFALALAAMLAAITRTAMGFKLPATWRSATAQVVQSLRGEQPVQRPAIAGPQVPAEQRSRAAAVAEAVAATQRREAAQVSMTAAAPRATGAGAARDAAPPQTATPFGQSYTRRTRARSSGSAGKRDSNR